nr:hypothetical protein [Amycolatopsis tolypomycina]
MRELITARATSTLTHLVIDLCGVRFLSATGFAAVEHGYLLATERGSPAPSASTPPAARCASSACCRCGSPKRSNRPDRRRPFRTVAARRLPPGPVGGPGSKPVLDIREFVCPARD